MAPMTAHTISINQRINRTIAMISIVLLLLFLTIWGITEFRAVNRELTQQTNYIITLSKTGLPTAVWNMDDAAIGELLDAIALKESLVYIAVREMNGKLLDKRAPNKYAEHDFHFFLDDPTFVAMESPIMHEGEAIATVQVALSSTKAKQAVYLRLGGTLLFGILMLGSIVAVLIIINKKYIFSPLKVLGNKAQQIADGDVDSKIIVESSDEIGKLASVFEHMRHSIKALLADLNLINSSLEDKVHQRTEELHAINKSIEDSINYASIIQSTLLPENTLLNNYFKEYFIIWHPKNIVGGDIYIFEEFSEDNGCLMMIIDCTGHGVPGAFVTMLVKAVERQLIAEMRAFNEAISPGKMLAEFNRRMRILLKQDQEDIICNAGFDGAILYYNKNRDTILFAGAETPLTYRTVDGEINMIKGSRHSIGYKCSDPNFVFKEHEIKTEPGMKFYLTTDGYLDQNGGEKGFCFGKKRFQKLLKEYGAESQPDQQEVLLYEMMSYQGEYERNDDVTVIGVTI